MHQRRPHRVGPGQVNAKRSIKFSTLGEAAASTPTPSGETDVLPGSTGLPEAGTFPNHPPGSSPFPAPFQPRQGYTPAEEDGASVRGRGRRWGMVVAALLLGLAGGWALSHFTATGASPNQPPVPPGPVAGAPRSPMDQTATARATVLVNQALRAEKSGDVPRATDLFTAAGKICPTFPGIHYRLALLSLRQGERSKAQTLLARSLAAGEEPAAVHHLQAALARLENQPELGFAELEAATRADPFNPRYLYYWAEALRRAGRLSEAQEKLEDAVVRSIDPGEESLYRLKLRLVQIELNQEDGFAGEFLARTRDATPAPPEWLLTAAALELKHADYAAAAAYLTRARQILLPATAAFLLNDQTFLDHAWRPELAPLYAPAADRATPPAPGAVLPLKVPPGSSAPSPTGVPSRPKAP